ADVVKHVNEPSLARVENVIGPIGVGIERAPSDIAGTNLVEVAVGPTHRSLDRKVQTIEPQCQRHLDAAQNHGLDVVHSDLSLGPRSAGLCAAGVTLSWRRGPALMPPLYDVPSRRPSSTARARPACGWRDR